MSYNSPVASATTHGTIAGGASSALLWTVHQAALMTRLRQDDVKPTTRLVGTITYLSAS